MGTKHGGNFREFAGKSQTVGNKIEEVQRNLDENKAAAVVVATAVDVLAATNPAIGTLIATYRISKTLYKITSKAVEVYQSTGDANSALQAAARETVEAAIGATRGETISNVVDVGWTLIKGSAGVATTSLQDKVLTSAAKNTLDEVLPK